MRLPVSWDRLAEMSPDERLFVMVRVGGYSKKVARQLLKEIGL